MVKRGRPRKTDARRYPNTGKTMPQDREEIKGVVKWNRLKEAVARNMEDPRWGSELGRWHYQGKIVAIQREAGERLLEIVTDHRKYGMMVDGVVIPLPKVHPKVSQMQRSIPGDPPAGDKDKSRRAQDAFDRIFAGIIDMGREGVASWKAVTRLCVDSEVLTYAEELLAKKALDRAAQILGLTGVTKFARGVKD